MRCSPLVLCAVAMLACAPPGTELSIEAPGEAGAVVSYARQSVTLDAQGRETLWVPALHTVVSGFGTLSQVDIVDGMDRPVQLHIELGGQALDTSPVCVPFYSEEGPIERASLRLRRVLADG